MNEPGWCQARPETCGRVGSGKTKRSAWLWCAGFPPAQKSRQVQGSRNLARSHPRCDPAARVRTAGNPPSGSRHQRGGDSQGKSCLVSGREGSEPGGSTWSEGAGRGGEEATPHGLERSTYSGGAGPSAVLPGRSLVPSCERFRLRGGRPAAPRCCDSGGAEVPEVPQRGRSRQRSAESWSRFPDSDCAPAAQDRASRFTRSSRFLVRFFSFSPLNCSRSEDAPGNLCAESCGRGDGDWLARGCEGRSRGHFGRGPGLTPTLHLWQHWVSHTERRARFSRWARDCAFRASRNYFRYLLISFP